MRKNILTKVMTFAVAAAICLSNTILPVTAHAEVAVRSQEQQMVMPMYIRIIACSNLLSLESYGKLNCQGLTEVQDGYIAEVIVELQRQDGSNWSTIKSWSNSNLYAAVITRDWYVEYGTYRLQLTHNAKTSTGEIVDSVVKYSRIVTY